jgi:hypothetical protein
MEPMTAKQAHEAAKGLTFEDARTAIMETVTLITPPESFKAKEW